MVFAAVLKDQQIGLMYLVGAPIFISLMLVHFYYCWRSVRECRRSRERAAYPPLRSDDRQAILQVEVY